MSKVFGLFLASVAVATAWSQPLAPPPERPAADSQELSRAQAYIESTSEAQSIEKNNQSALKIRNCLQLQTTFHAIQSEMSYKRFEWPGFYEFRNPSDKAIVITDFRVKAKPNLYEQKLLKVTAKTSRVEAFSNLDDMNESIETASVKHTPVRFPIKIAPHTTQFLKVHLVLEVSASDKVLEFDNENEANKWLSAGLGFEQNSNGQFWCAITGFPIEVATADHKILQYEPFTALLVPGCQLILPRPH
jgi:hypothetical protein